jgi:DNA mismatch repair protein MutH
MSTKLKSKEDISQIKKDFEEVINLLRSGKIEKSIKTEEDKIMCVRSLAFLSISARRLKKRLEKSIEDNLPEDIMKI